MPVLQNANHEAFAHAIAAGHSAKGAYLQVYTGTTPTSAKTQGPRLMKQPHVQHRVDELRSAAAAQCSFDLAKTVDYLVEILTTPVGQVDESHPLCQEFQESTTRTGTTRKCKMPGKLDALEKLIKLRGWYKPEKLEHAGAVTVNADVEDALKALGF